MANYTPLGGLLKKYGIEEEDNTNIYDDGSVWSLPETPTETPTYGSPISKLLSSNTYTTGVSEALKNAPTGTVEDPLGSARNQVQYYTNKLNDMGVEEEKPSILQKGLGLAGKALEIGFAVPNSISNAVTGTFEGFRKSNEKTQQALESTSAFRKLKEMGYTTDGSSIYDLKTGEVMRGFNFDGADEAHALREQAWNESKGNRANAGDYLSNIGKESVKSFINTYKSAFGKTDYSEVSDLSNVIERAKNSDTTMGDVVKSQSERTLTAKGLQAVGVDKEKSGDISDLVDDLVLSFGIGGVTDIDGAGKALKTLRKSDKLDEISKVANMSDALELAKKYNSYDDFVSELGEKASKYNAEQLTKMYENSVQTYAQDLIKDVNKGLGGIKNFEGLKVGNQVVLSPEQLSKISKDKVQSTLLKAGLSVYSPISAIVNNKVVDTVVDAYNKTEVGQAVNNTIYKAFGGGANNEWLKAMKENPEKALQYANERKQVKLTKKVGEDRIQKVMETINKYSDIKETPEELTKVIENPVTREARQVKVEREMLSPEYVSKMMNLGKNEREKLVSSLNIQKSNLKKQLTELNSIGDSAKKNNELAKGIEQEIKNLENRISRVNEVASSKSIDFNKQMSKFGYKADYSDLFDKAITTDIEELTEQLGDRDLAEALQESANRVLDNLDKKYEGLSEYFTSYSKINGKASKNASNFEGEEILDRAKKANVSVNLDDYRTDKGYKQKVEGILKYREDLNKQSSEKLSKNNEVFKKEGFEGSGDIIEDYKKIINMRKGEGSTPILELGDSHKTIKSELEALKNPSKIDLESETPRQKKIREKLIKQYEKELEKTSIADVRKGGTVNETTGEILPEPNSASGEELEKLANKMYKKELDKIDSNDLYKKVKEYETEGLGYIESKKEAKKVAKEIIDELSIDKSVDEVANELMLDGAEYLKKLKEEVKTSHYESLMKLTNDEVEILQRELSRRENWKVKSSKKKELTGIENGELDKVKSTIPEGDISVTGKDRTKWVENEEAKKATTRTKYDGTEYNPIDYQSTKEVSVKDNRKKLREQKAEILDLIEDTKEELGMKAKDIEEVHKPKFSEEELDELEAKYQKGLEVHKNKTALDKLVSKVKKTEPSSPFAKEVEKGLPENLKGIKTLKFNTEKGEILIDSDINSTDLAKIIKTSDYDANKIGTRIVYTNKRMENGAIGRYYYDNDTIYINVNGLGKKQLNTVVEHEFGHKVMNKIMKSNPDLTEEMVTIPFLKYYRNLDSTAKEKFISAVTKANKSNVPTEQMVNLGLVTKYLNKITKEGASLKEISQEGFAELYSLFNNPNKSVQRMMKQVDKDAFKNFTEIMSKYTPEDTVEVSKLIRKRFGDDYANQILDLKNKKDALTDMSKTISESLKKANDIKDTKATISEIEGNIKQLEHLMDNTSYDEAGNIINRDYEEFFENLKAKNPEQAKIIEEKYPKYKKVFELEEQVFEIDNTKDLSDKAKSYMEEYKQSMKEIALREGIYDEEDAEAFTTYVMHMINPKYSDDAELIEKGRKLKQELTDPLNVYSLSRKKQGTIEELNKASYNQDGIKIFEENINRIFLKRAIDSEKFVFKKRQTERVLEEFAVPIITNFDKEVNNFDHMFDKAGKELLDKTGLSKDELKKLYNDKYGNSYNFVKENLFEDFKNKFSSLEEGELKQAIEEELFGLNTSERLHNRVVNSVNDGKFDEAIDKLFEAKYRDLNKFNYAETFLEKYGYNAKFNDPMANIPKYTDDGRPYVYKPLKDENGKPIPRDLSKEMPYGIEGGTPYEKLDAIGSYNDFVYRTAKDKNMIIVTMPNENPERVVKRTVSDTAMEEAIKDRTTVAEKINGLISGDKEAIEGFDALAGYNVIDPSKIKYEEFIADTGTKKYLIDKNAWENYQKAIKDAEYKEKNALLKIYDGISNIFKSQAIFSVSFHERNAIQNIISSYVKTGANLLDPVKNKEALDILRYKAGNIELNKSYNGYTVDEILLQAEKSGIFETQVENEFAKDVTKKFLKGETDKIETKTTKLTQKINPFSTEFLGYTASRKVAEGIENQAKMVNIITHLENGFTLSDAIDMTKETLFDYSDLTQFESNVMRRAIPFYTFMRKNIPSQIDNLMNHNARMARIQSIYNKSSEKFETDKERTLRPDYLDGMLAIGNNKYLNLGDATQDLNKLTDAKEMLSGLNPIIKTPLELLFNKQLYSDSEVSKYDKSLEKAKYAVETTIPMYRQMSALHKLLTGTEEEKEKAENTLAKTFGSLVNEYDTEKQEKTTMYEYIDQLQNQYYEYIEKHPEKLKELEEKQLAEKNKKSYTSPLSKLIKN